MILLIDNYDSFSYNLYQLIGEFDPKIKVIRNDEMTVEEIRKLHPDQILLSPGPGRPEDAGILIDVVKELGKEIPVLGVCLGHQAICAAFGAEITYAKKRMHGKQSEIELDTDSLLFRNCSEKTFAARYHSLAADGEVMAVAHRKCHIYGVQFHPESIMTPEGRQMLYNFIHLKDGGARQ